MNNSGNRDSKPGRPRLIFFGSPDFAVASLDALVRNGFQVAGVVTAPDKPSGRGLVLSETAVKRFAVTHQLPLFQPVRLKDQAFLSALSDLHPDMLVVVAFRMLPEEVWGLPGLGTINLHASLLPQYRGAAPINRAIMNGEPKTGVTTFFINREIDRGAILLQQAVSIGDDETAGELHDRLMNLGSSLLIRTVEEVFQGRLKPVPQEEWQEAPEPLHSAPKLQKADTVVQWHTDTRSAYNQIRGLSPFPGAFTELRLRDGRVLPLKIGRARIAEQAHSPDDIPGTVMTDGKHFLGIGTCDGVIELLEVQPASKRAMKIQDFLNGFGSKLA